MSLIMHRMAVILFTGLLAALCSYQSFATFYSPDSAVDCSEPNPDDSVVICIHGPYTPCPRDSMFPSTLHSACRNECDTCKNWELEIKNFYWNKYVDRVEVCTDWGCDSTTPHPKPCDSTYDTCVVDWNHICQFCWANASHFPQSCLWVEDPSCSRLLPTPPDTLLNNGYTDSLCIANCIRLVADSSHKELIPAPNGIYGPIDILWIRFGITGYCCDTSDKCIWVCVRIKDTIETSHGDSIVYDTKCTMLKVRGSFYDPQDGLDSCWAHHYADTGQSCFSIVATTYCDDTCHVIRVCDTCQHISSCDSCYILEPCGGNPLELPPCYSSPAPMRRSQFGNDSTLSISAKWANGDRNHFLNVISDNQQAISCRMTLTDSHQSIIATRSVILYPGNNPVVIDAFDYAADTCQLSIETARGNIVIPVASITIEPQP